MPTVVTTGPGVSQPATDSERALDELYQDVLHGFHSPTTPTSMQYPASPDRNGSADNIMSIYSSYSELHDSARQDPSGSGPTLTSYAAAQRSASPAQSSSRPLPTVQITPLQSRPTMPRPLPSLPGPPPGAGSPAIPSMPDAKLYQSAPQLPPLQSTHSDFDMTLHSQESTVSRHATFHSADSSRMPHPPRRLQSAMVSSPDPHSSGDSSYHSRPRVADPYANGSIPVTLPVPMHSPTIEVSPSNPLDEYNPASARSSTHSHGHANGYSQKFDNTSPNLTPTSSLSPQGGNQSGLYSHPGSVASSYHQLPEPHVLHPSGDPRYNGSHNNALPTQTYNSSDSLPKSASSGTMNSSYASGSSDTSRGSDPTPKFPSASLGPSDDGLGDIGASLMRSNSMVDSPASMASSQAPLLAGTLGRNTSVGSQVSYQSPLSAQPSDIFIRSQASTSFSDATSVDQLTPATSVTAGPSYWRHENEISRVTGMHSLFEQQHEDDEDFYPESEDDESQFVNFALLSHLAVRLRDKVPRGEHTKGSIPYPRAFTGKDIVSTIQSAIHGLLTSQGIPSNDRRIALQVARSLQNQLFFYEVEWGGKALSDGVEDVFMFLDDDEGPSGSNDAGWREREELPTAVLTVLTRCYSPSCGEGGKCYAYGCPRNNQAIIPDPSPATESPPERKSDWLTNVPPEILATLPDSEKKRQTIIHKVISKEEQYIKDLDLVESLFIRPLRNANPRIIPLDYFDEFFDDIFGNILDLRETNRRLVEILYIRLREQGPIINRIGDVFLNFAAEFRLVYPTYVGRLSNAEKRLKEEIEGNSEFRRFLEHQSRNQQDTRRLDLKHFLSRPSEHLQKYPVLLEAILKETSEGNPDIEFLSAASQAIKDLQEAVQLLAFQASMCRNNKPEWHELVSESVRKSFSKQAAKRQSIIFELIATEMEYVRDLETINSLFLKTLIDKVDEIIPRDRLPQFIQDVFSNFAEIHGHHRRLLDRLHRIQRDEHPRIKSVTAAVFDAALNWREAYLEYIPHYPIAAYKIDDEIATNPAFKAFIEQCLKHPDSKRLDLKAFIYRPIPRLLRYDLLLKGIMEESPVGDDDKSDIPQVLEVIKDLGKTTEPLVSTSKQKVELWTYNSALVWKTGEAVDMDLLAETRTLVHAGKLFRPPDGGLEWNGWTELFVLLFDNYLVITKPKEKDGVKQYHVNKRPIPLELLSLLGFSEVAQQRSTGLLRGLRGGERSGTSSDNQNPTGGADATQDTTRSVYPFTVHHAGRMGGHYHLFAESAQIRSEWKQKLEEAIGLRSVVQESNKVFDMEPLSNDNFLLPSMIAGPTAAPWNSPDSPMTGKVTCSVPFSTANGTPLVAIGCAEGVWIGLRHAPSSMRRVLHLKLVTQCAMLEEFGIFLVLADKSLYAYHVEALVPSNPPSVNSARTPQKLNGNKDVQFFSVGTLNGRTLVIYMKKKGLDSVFRVLEPVTGKINEKAAKAPGTFGRLNFGSNKSEWFRVYRDFFLPSESFDLVFLKAKIAILCTKGFEIMDLTDFKSVTIPQRDDPRMAAIARRCESCRPLGMFRSSENEFLLCYDEFGLYVDRHGDPSRNITVIEWEGTGEHAAFHPPYVLIFDQRFIEIRHIDNGRLVQIIRGQEIRCIWDGRGGGSGPFATTPGPGGWEDNNTSESRVHAVMRAPQASANSKYVAQHVFELTATVPLYLPPSIRSPTTSSYFPQTNSPPHSPRTSSINSWR